MQITADSAFSTFLKQISPSYPKQLPVKNINVTFRSNQQEQKQQQLHLVGFLVNSQSIFGN